jgi:hypothetical protein
MLTPKFNTFETLADSIKVGAKLLPLSKEELIVGKDLEPKPKKSLSSKDWF